MKPLDDACRRTLVSWLTDALDSRIDLGTLRRRDQDNESAAYELRRLTPKAAAAIEALDHDSESGPLRAQWKAYLRNARRPDGLWEFVLRTDAPAPGDIRSESPGDVMATALVLRALAPLARDNKTDHDFWLESVLAVLNRLHDARIDPVRRLFVLNAASLAKCGAKLRRTIRRRMLEAAEEVFSATRRFPLRFANPVTIDYHADGRVRELRYPADIVLLETLVLLSGPQLLYIESHMGRAILERLSLTVADVPMERDTSGHRPALTTVFYYRTTLQLVLLKPKSRVPRLLRWLAGATIASWRFSHRLKLGVLAVSTIALGEILAHDFGFPGLGALARSVGAEELGHFIIGLLKTLR
jgi:hypothetical protein